MTISGEGTSKSDGKKGTITPVITDDEDKVPSGKAVLEAMDKLADPLFLEYSIINTNASKESLKKVIKDVWFTGMDEILNIESYYVKIGVFGKKQDGTDTFMISVYLTNGLSTATPDLYSFSANNFALTDKVGHCIAKCSGLLSAECHILLDASELVAEDTTPYAGYDLILNEGVARQSLIIKKRVTGKVIGDPLIADNSIDYKKVKASTFYDNDISSEGNKTVRTRDIFQLNRMLGTSMISHETLTSEDINDDCIFSYQDETGKTSMGSGTRFICKEYSLNKNDVLCIYGRCSGNGMAFMISKKTGENTYRCLCRENGEEPGFYTTVADEDGIYAVCAYFNNSRDYHVYRFTSTVLSTICDSLRQKAEASEMRSHISAVRKLYLFKKALFCGDSVTKGMVTEGTLANPNAIASDADTEYSYPSRFHDMFPSIEVEVLARSGISATGWKTEFLPTADFGDYDLIVFELGLNGYLNINDVDTEGTNTNDYRKIIQKAREDNPAATLVLVASSHYTDHWVPILDIFAEECGCIVIDLKDKTFLNLDDPIYHGYTVSGGESVMDYAHFTRKGYLAKAFVVSRMIEARLSDETE